MNAKDMTQARVIFQGRDAALQEQVKFAKELDDAKRMIQEYKDPEKRATMAQQALIELLDNPGHYFPANESFTSLIKKMAASAPDALEGDTPKDATGALRRLRELATTPFPFSDSADNDDTEFRSDGYGPQIEREENMNEQEEQCEKAIDPRLWDSWAKSPFRTASLPEAKTSVLGPQHFVHNPLYAGRFCMEQSGHGWLHVSENGSLVRHMASGLDEAYAVPDPEQKLAKIGKELGPFIVEVFVDAIQAGCPMPLLLGLCCMFDGVNLANANHPADMMTPTRAIVEAFTWEKAALVPLAVTVAEKQALVEQVAELGGQVEWISGGEPLPVFRRTSASMDIEGKINKTITAKMRKLCLPTPTAHTEESKLKEKKDEAGPKGPTALEMFLQGELWVDAMEDEG